MPLAWQPSPGERTQYDGADMPSSDLPEHHIGTEPVPLPPDISKLPKIPGYETIGHQSTGAGSLFLPPTQNGVHQPDATKPDEQYSSTTHISEDEARDALLSHVSKFCCYGKSAAAGMQIITITPTNAMRYTLETFTESRNACWEQEPYRGQNVDTPSSGTAPLPWAVSSEPSSLFNGQVQTIEVPHTAIVMPCHACNSMGWLRCHGCQGRGYKKCITCNGSAREWKVDAHGHRHAESCWHCQGSGRKRCQSCSNDGRIACKTCQGYRKLKCYIKLTVNYKNHKAEHVVEKTTDLPVKLVKSVTGVTVFEQSLPKVWPVTCFPDQEVCMGSKKLVEEHNNKYRQCRIVMQRQKLRSVPVSECTYKWKAKQGRFWVYGNENNVHAPNYPQQCCWGCNIL